MNTLDTRSPDCTGLSMSELIQRQGRRGARRFSVSPDHWQLLYRLERANAGVSVVAEEGRATLLLPAFGEFARIEAVPGMGDDELRWG